MARKCSICTHPDKKEIDAAILANATLDDISQQYCVSRDAVGRHNRMGHVLNLVAEIQKDEEVQEAFVVAKEMAIGQLADYAMREERWANIWVALEQEAKKTKGRDLLNIIKEQRQYLTAEKDLLIKTYEAKLKEMELRLKEHEAQFAAGSLEPIKIEYEVVN